MGCTRLQDLTISDVTLGRADIESISTFLQSPDCHLRYLLLACSDIRSDFDDNYATILANALRYNKTLEEMELPRAPYTGRLTEKGWSAFSNALCNTERFDLTYYSNHTLQKLDQRLCNTPSDVMTILELNTDPNKQAVAIEKVKLYYPHLLDMEPFFGVGLQMLPMIIDKVWSVDVLRWGAIYQFARVMPFLSQG